MTEEQIIAQGLEADRICSSEVYQGAWKRVMDDIFKQWAESPLDDVAGRERTRLELDVLQRLKGKFAGYMNDASISKHNKERSNDV